MMRSRAAMRSAVVLAVIVATLAPSPGGVPPAGAQAVVSPYASYLRVDYAVEPGKGGRMKITGYIYNSWDKWATDVRLLVEALDAAGEVTGSTSVSVYGKVPPGNRSYFDSALTATGASYRVNVQSVEFRTFGAGGG